MSQYLEFLRYDATDNMYANVNTKGGIAEALPVHLYKGAKKIIKLLVLNNSVSHIIRSFMYYFLSKNLLLLYARAYNSKRFTDKSIHPITTQLWKIHLNYAISSAKQQ